jgi:hypothetical protein
MNTSFLLNKTFRRAALVSAIALGIFGASNSFAAKSGTATSTAAVIKPITLSVGQILNFGRFAGSAEAGTLTVTTDGARTSTGGVVESSVDAGLVKAATFNVVGENNATYAIDYTTTATVFTNGTSSEDMTFTKITDLSASTITSDDITTGELNASGDQTIFVGGTLAVGIDQPKGAYAGDIVVAVEYN